MLTAPSTQPLRPGRAWAVWGVAALFVVYNYLQQVAPGVLADDLARDFRVSAVALGHLAACFFYAYAILQIPVGLAVDRWGPRWPLIGAISVAALGSVGFGAAQTLFSAGLARLLIGAGAAFSFIACLKLAANWFAPRRFATLAGLTNTAGMLGAAGGPLLAALVLHTGWRTAMYLLGGVGAILVAAALVLVRDRPRTDAEPEPLPDPAERPGGAWRGITSRRAWINAFYATAISISFVAFGALWGPSYVAKTQALDLPAATGVVAWLFLGAIGGSVFFGWYSDRVRSRQQPMLAAAGGGFLLLAVILYLPGLPLGGLRVLLALLGFCCSANILAYAVAHDISPPGRAGLALGFLNTCYYGGNALSQPLIGGLLDWRRPGGLAAFQAADYRFAFTAVLVLLAVAALAAAALEETHPAARL